VTRFLFARRALAAILLLASASASVLAQEQREEFKNLKVLPKDIAPEDLRRTMSGFTRALGVRCTYCHVGQEGKPVAHEDFPKDDKPTKEKARAMMRMVQDINDKYLANLSGRSDPPIRVQCFTCHHGIAQPRTLQDVLSAAYTTGGLDSTRARYQALRGRYYGRAAYDFGEVPLADVAGQLRSGHATDAESLLALNVAMNPTSNFARRQHAELVLMGAFASGKDAGAAAYRSFRDRYGAPVVGEDLMNAVGYELMGSGQTDAALNAFAFNVGENPKSTNTYESLGEAYSQKGDSKQAIAAYQKSLELDPSNQEASDKLAELKAKPKSKGKNKGK
jgi:tetratricopeptide (TPR) repeat protein